MKQIVLDFETRSEANLKKVGGVKYAQDPSTEILCVGYKIDDKPAKLWRPMDSMPPGEFILAAREKSVTWIAHNALFEQSIYEWVLRKTERKLSPLPPHRWKCTAAKAAACALPRNLEGAALATNIPVKKNMDGRRLMLKYSKPRTAWVKWKKEGKYHDGVFRGADKESQNLGWMRGEPDKYFSDKEELGKIYDYCLTDVEAEWHLDRVLPDLIPIEQQIWIMNQEMNLRGVQVDEIAVRLILKMVADLTLKMQNELKELTGGAVTTGNQRNRILEWLEENGVVVDGLSAATVADVLTWEGLKPNAKRVLEIRQTLSKSSTKKYQAILDRAGVDGRVRDLQLYHGAHTGRDSGTGLQLHNLPKGTVKDTDEAIYQIIKHQDLEWLETIYGDPMKVFSSCIRGMVTASKGHKLFVADYNAIEARVLSWLAGDETSLELFRKNKDPYIVRAAKIFNIEHLEEVTSEQRFVGKIAELALGYQMGAAKFLATCHAWGADYVTEAIAEAAVQSFRSDRTEVVKLWSVMEKAAIFAVNNPQNTVKIAKLKFYMIRYGANALSPNFLNIELPSGRCIRYQSPEVRREPTPWGKVFPKLYYWSVNSLTKKWECGASYGGLLTENVVQAISRDIMFQAGLRVKKAGYTYLFSVHDELVCESVKGDVKEYETILTTLPPWAKGLPLKASGWSDFRYRKN